MPEWLDRHACSEACSRGRGRLVRERLVDVRVVDEVALGCELPGSLLVQVTDPLDLDILQDPDYGYVSEPSDPATPDYSGLQHIDKFATAMSIVFPLLVML